MKLVRFLKIKIMILMNNTREKLYKKCIYTAKALAPSLASIAIRLDKKKP